MRRLLYLLLLLATPAFATSYTVTADILPMEQGAVAPDLFPYTVYNGTAYTGAPSSIFSTKPTCTSSVSSSSAVGHVAIACSGAVLVSGGDTVTYVAGYVDVIANPLSNGSQVYANIVNTQYPSGYVAGPGGQPYPPVDPTTTSTYATITAGAGANQTTNTTNLNNIMSRGGTQSCTSSGSPKPMNVVFPAGNFYFNGTLNFCGSDMRWTGQGHNTKIILAADTATSAMTFINMPSVGSEDSFRTQIQNLEIEVQGGNPQATALLVNQNNQGAIRNVTIVNDDSNMLYGFYESGGGPSLGKDLAIHGAQTCLYAGSVQYSLTLDRINMAGCTNMGINNRAQALTVNHLFYRGATSALSGTSGADMTPVVMNANLGFTGTGTTAIGINQPYTSKSSLYLKNLTSTFPVTYSDSEPSTPVTGTGNVTEYMTTAPVSIFDSSYSSYVHLAEVQTPDPADQGTVSSWAQLGTTVSNWPSQISACTNATYYASPGSYTSMTSGTYAISVPDCVNHIDFGTATPTNGEPASGLVFNITIAGTSTTPLVIDGVPYGTTNIIHTGSRGVALRDSSPISYIASSGAGTVWLEDVSPSRSANPPTTSMLTFAPGQSVYAKQLNPEASITAKMYCNGCNLWIQGLKTEMVPSNLIAVPSGGHNPQVEILGGFVFPLTWNMANVQANASVPAASIYQPSNWTVNSPLSGTPAVQLYQDYAQTLTQSQPAPTTDIFGDWQYFVPLETFAISSISVDASGNETVTTSTPHNIYYADKSSVSVTGAVPSALNGNNKLVTAVTSNTVVFSNVAAASMTSTTPGNISSTSYNVTVAATPSTGSPYSFTGYTDYSYATLQSWPGAFDIQGTNFFATQVIAQISTTTDASARAWPNMVIENRSGSNGAYPVSMAQGIDLYPNFYSLGAGGSTPTAATPTFSPAAGTYSSTQSVTLACSTASSTINYTLDGSTPTTGSATYSSALSISSTTTVTAICSASGYNTSSPTSAAYTISATPTAATPTFSPAAGIYLSAQSVSLSCSTASSTIYYTTNGTTPTTGSSVYSSAISVPSTTTIKAICAASGYSNSATASGTFTISAISITFGTVKVGSVIF